MKLSDLNIEVATKQLWESTRCQDRETVEAILKAALPQPRNWGGEEPLSIGHRVLEDGDVCVIKALSDTCTDAVVEWPDGSFTITNTIRVRPIPTIKKIDHSSLEGSGIDCVYKTQTIEYIGEYSSDLCFKSIRMNQPVVLTEAQVKMIPEGYDIQILTNSLCKYKKLTDLDFLSDICNIIKIVGIKEGWEL